MNYYKLGFEDFKRVFKFGTSYYLEPGKTTVGRTTGEPRGLGAVMDSFTLGKLTEIGVEKIFSEFNNKKSYVLDFDIKTTSTVKDEADVLFVKENEVTRHPEIFIEIKNTSESDRWIGLTEEQFNTIKRSAKNKKIYMIYASIRSDIANSNPKTADLTGMFLKEIENSSKSKIFQEFAKLNAECRIEFIISSDDLIKFAFPFEKGMNMYETNLFEEKQKKSFYSQNGLRKDVLKMKTFRNFNSIINLEIEKGILPERRVLFEFKINGNFKLIYKKKKTFIECFSDVIMQNDVFGIFHLKEDKCYNFNLSTLGRDPKLKRNNLFISKRNVFQLIEKGFIRKPEDIVTEIVRDI